jgi:hypothetical protein
VSGTRADCSCTGCSDGYSGTKCEIPPDNLHDFDLVGQGQCADANGNTDYNYCKYVDFQWSDMTGGAENCAKQGSLNVATFGTNIIGMYYVDGERNGEDESLKPQCYFLFASAEDVPGSYIHGSRMFTRCTDGTQLAAKGALGAITQTIGLTGECYLRAPAATDDTCSATYENMNMPADSHPVTSTSDGRGMQAINGQYYYCPPGTHWGGSLQRLQSLHRGRTWCLWQHAWWRLQGPRARCQTHDWCNVLLSMPAEFRFYCIGE